MGHAVYTIRREAIGGVHDGKVVARLEFDTDFPKQGITPLISVWLGYPMTAENYQDFVFNKPSVQHAIRLSRICRLHRLAMCPSALIMRRYLDRDIDLLVIVSARLPSSSS